VPYFDLFVPNRQYCMKLLKLSLILIFLEITSMSYTAICSVSLVGTWYKGYVSTYKPIFNQLLDLADE